MILDELRSVYRVRLTTDKEAIYDFLSRDPVYAAYAIGDLEPAYFEACTWFLAQAGDQARALALIYRRLYPPVLLTMGEPAAVVAIFHQVELPEQIYMHAQVQHLDAFRWRFDFRSEQHAIERVRPMLRMSVDQASFNPVPSHLAAGLVTGHGQLRRLGLEDHEALVSLYGQGGRFAPDAFERYQLEDGIFWGLTIEDQLVAAAGTHLLAHGTQQSCTPQASWDPRPEGRQRVAAIGNIYTHPAQRGRGYGQIVTSALTNDLLRQGLLVVLNVDQDNAVAIHIYRKLGYRVHCPFYEGIGRLN